MKNPTMRMNDQSSMSRSTGRWKHLEDHHLLGMVYQEAILHGCCDVYVSPRKMEKKKNRTFRNMREALILWTA
jgi:hypothetical protein